MPQTLRCETELIFSCISHPPLFFHSVKAPQSLRLPKPDLLLMPLSPPVLTFYPSQRLLYSSSLISLKSIHISYPNCHFSCLLPTPTSNSPPFSHHHQCLSTGVMILPQGKFGIVWRPFGYHKVRQDANGPRDAAKHNA